MKRFFWLLVLLIVACKQQDTISCICTSEYNPVYVGENQYPNPCKAKCDGYRDSQITFLLTQEQIAAGMMVSVDCSI